MKADERDKATLKAKEEEKTEVELPNSLEEEESSKPPMRGTREDREKETGESDRVTSSSEATSDREPTTKPLRPQKYPQLQSSPIRRISQNRDHRRSQVLVTVYCPQANRNREGEKPEDLPLERTTGAYGDNETKERPDLRPTATENKKEE